MLCCSCSVSSHTSPRWIPRVIYEAECQSHHCSYPGSHQHMELNSVPIYSSMLVLTQDPKNRKCFTIKFRKIAVGCMCVRARTSPWCLGAHLSPINPISIHCEIIVNGADSFFVFWLLTDLSVSVYNLPRMLLCIYSVCIHWSTPPSLTRIHKCTFANCL